MANKWFSRKLFGAGVAFYTFTEAKRWAEACAVAVAYVAANVAAKIWGKTNGRPE